MVARRMKIFRTEHAVELLGLNPEKDKWRVIKLAQGKEYEITPALSDASGSGTRRLYDLENVCELALALRLLETGLRSKVIGKVLRQLRQKGKLSSKLEKGEGESGNPYLCIIRTPLTGQLLKKERPQQVAFVTGFGEAKKLLAGRPADDLILVPVGSLFLELRERLDRLAEEERKKLEERRKGRK